MTTGPTSPLDRGITESDFDYTVNFAVEQMARLPGDLTDPTNAVWQMDEIQSIEKKARLIRAAHRPDLISHLDAQLRYNAARIHSLGAVTTAGSLVEIADFLNPPETQAPTNPVSPVEGSAA